MLRVLCYCLVGTATVNPLFPTPRFNPAVHWAPSSIREYPNDPKRDAPNRVLHQVSSFPYTQFSKTIQEYVAPTKQPQTEVSIRRIVPPTPDVIIQKEALPPSLPPTTAAPSEAPVVEVPSTSKPTQTKALKKRPTKLFKEGTASPKSKYKYGSRLGRINMAPASQVAAAAVAKNITYYPKDHQDDATVYRFTKLMANDERRVLNSMGTRVKDGMEHFYDVMDRFPPLPEGTKRPRLTASQTKLFNSMKLQLEGDPYCQGCAMDTYFPIRKNTRNAKYLVFRKFNGNREERSPSVQFTGGCEWVSL